MPASVRAVETWVDLAAESSAQTAAIAAAQTEASWSQMAAWYSTAAATTQAAEAAALSRAAQESVFGAYVEYMSQVVAMMRGTRVEVPRVQLVPDVRGVDPAVVHTRPVYAYRETMAFTGDDDAAFAEALARALATVDDDLMLAARAGQNESMKALGVTSYRRVLRPELSQDGPCGLCVVASDQIYSTDDLLPLHARCKCETLPIVGEQDPGRSINAADLKRIYAAAGDSTHGDDLKRVRVVVKEHGELGPVLVVRGQRFKDGPDVPKPFDPVERQRRLDVLGGILDGFKAREAAGEDLTGPIGYSEHRIARLQTAA